MRLLNEMHLLFNSIFLLLIIRCAIFGNISIVASKSHVEERFRFESSEPFFLKENSIRGREISIVRIDECLCNNIRIRKTILFFDLTSLIFIILVIITFLAAVAQTCHRLDRFNIKKKRFLLPAKHHFTCKLKAINFPTILLQLNTKR